MSDSILRTLREAARTCPNVLTAKMLRDSADDIARLIVALSVDISIEALQALNGAVAKAIRTLSTVESSDPRPRGGAMPVPERMAA